MKNETKIENAIANGYEMNITGYISRGWESFKEYPGGFIGFLIVSGLISFVVNLIPFIGFLITAIVLSPILTLGNAIVCDFMSKKQYPEFGQFFKGFDKAGEIIVVNLLIALIFLVLFIPLVLIIITTIGANILLLNQSANPFEAIGPGALLGIVVTSIIVIYISFGIRWAPLLVYFNNYPATKAISTSFRLVNKQFFQHLAFGIICFLVALLGVLALIIGILVAVPVIKNADFHAFEEITGLNDEDEKEDHSFITDSLV